MAGVMLVTGASRGIGAAVARLAGKRGWAVAVNYARNEAAAAEVVRDIEEAGGRAIAVGADVADEAAVEGLFATVDAELGALTALCNNAGWLGPATTLAKLETPVLHQLMAVNVFGAFYCARAAVRRMAKSAGGQGGSIVNLSSMAAVLGGAGEAVHYAASKGAIDSMTIGLAREAARDGIRVNALRPGLIDTEMQLQGGDPARLARLVPSVPMARAGTADEVAEAVLWLASDAASYVTGTIFNVSGGR